MRNFKIDDVSPCSKEEMEFKENTVKFDRIRRGWTEKYEDEWMQWIEETKG